LSEPEEGSRSGIRSAIVGGSRQRLAGNGRSTVSAGSQIKESPAIVFERASVPAANSMTVNPRSDAVMRQGGTAARTLITRPSLATNATSIGKRMKNVCTAFEGAMISAVPGGSPSRPSNPRRRDSESKAVRSRSATTARVLTFTRT